MSTGADRVEIMLMVDAGTGDSDDGQPGSAYTLSDGRLRKV